MRVALIGLVLLLLALPSPFVAGGISSVSHPAPPTAPTEFQAMAPLAAGLTGTYGMQVGGPLAPSTMVSGGLSFNGTDVAGQQSLLNALYTPGSPEYHHFLVGDQFNLQFAPNAALQASLLSYLTAHHLAVTQTSVYLWNLVGTAQDMGSAFGTTYVSGELHGHAGYAPTGPLLLPKEFQGFASVSGGFQTVDPPVPRGLLQVPYLTVPGFHAVHEANPLATLSINITSPYIIQYQKGNNAIAFPPTNLNTTWTVTISGGTAPYSVSWHWWDGTVQRSQTSGSSISNFHTYYEPGQADYCDVVVCGNVTVFVNDSASGSASYNVGLVPGVSPHTLELYYDISTLLRHGDSGQGTKVGLDEMCDPSYSSSTYLSDLTTYSTDMGLPAPSLQLIGTGASTCTGGSSGWSGETLLDMEAVHASAPNATIVADLADASITEGDCKWNTLSNGVYLASNSWGSTVATTCWATALSQGQSYQTASGDCGAFTSGTRDEPADFAQGVGVGGTDVYPEPAGTFLREFAWNGTFQPSCSNNEGSTGGYSSVAAPWYQTGMTGFSGTKRGVPDVAAIGGTWFWMIYSGGVSLSAGTSLACPAYTAMLDLMWQYNSSTPAPQGMANYDLYAIAKSTDYGSAMHDIVVGNNIHGTSPPGSGYTTTVGWDPVTGLGSPDVGKLAMYLAAQNGNPSAFGAVTAVLASNVSYGATSLAVAFGADVTGGTSPLTGYSYAWTFGDGGTASTLDPWTSHAYTTPGTYWASVKVTQGANSGTSNGVMIKVISLTSGSGGGGNPSVSSPVPSRSSTDVGQAAVTFSTTASGGTGTYSAFAWTVSPASAGLSCTASTAASSTSCTATAAGAFTVSVTVTDSAGHTSSAATSASFPVYPTPSVSPPSPSSTSLTLGQTVTFTSTAGRTGSGGDTYAWTTSPATGAGCTSSTTLTYSCTPTATGTYTATITVTDSNSGTGSNTSSGVTVSGGSGGNPSVTAPTATPASIDAGQAVTFKATPSGGSGTYTSFAWTVSPSGGLGCTATTSTGSTPCTSSSAGTYAVSVTVTDSAGHTSSAASSSFVVSPDPSVTSPTPSSSPGTVGTSVSFTTTLSNPGSGGDSYTWAASLTGLGCTSASALSIGCTPSAAGTYVVTVVVKDSNGGTGTASSASFTVSSSSGGNPLTASAAGTPTSGNAPLLVAFTGAGSGGTPGYTYSWNFGDGSASSAVQDPSHTYTSAGSYSAVLTVTDSAAHTATSSVGITVSTAPPGSLIVNAQATPNPASVGATITFTALVSGGTPPLTYVWVFGDGAKSTTPNATHAFQTAGTYPVSVFVNDSAGRSKQVTLALSVQGGGGGGSGSGSGGLSSMVGPLPLWALLLVVVLVVAAVAAILLTRRRRPMERAPEAWGPTGAEVAAAPAPAPVPPPTPVLPPTPPPPPAVGPTAPPDRPVDEIAPDPFGGRGQR